MTEPQTLSDSFSMKASLWKQGTMAKKEKGIIRSVWKDRFVILFEGSLFYYQASSELTPRGVIPLLNATIEEVSEKKAKRKYCFILRSLREEITFGCSDEVDMKSWIASISENFNKSPSPPPSKEFKVRSKTAVIFMTSKIAETITNSGIGGKIVRDLLSDEAVVMIDSLKNYYVQKLGSEKASKIEKQAISIAVKAALLYKDKKLSIRDIVAASTPIRLLVSKLIDGFEIPFTFSASEAVDSIRDVQAALEKVLKPVFTEKTNQKLTELFAVFCDEDLIEDFYVKRKWRECEIIATTLRELWDNGQF